MTDETSFCFDDSFTTEDVDVHVSKLKGLIENLSLNEEFKGGQVLEECLASCSNQQLEEKVFGVILPVARRSLCQILGTINENLNNREQVKSDDLKQSLLITHELLNIWMKSMEHISDHHNHQQLPPSHIKSLLETSPEIVKLVFQHCKTSSEAYGILFDRVSTELSNLFHKSNAILKRFFATIDGVIVTDNDSQVEMEVLVNVIDTIGSIVTIVNGMDLRTHVEVSRAFGKLAVKHHEIIKRVPLGNITLHLEQLAKDLCSTMSAFKDSSNDIEERTIKATGLLLKILEKLLMTYASCINNDSFVPVFELLLYMHRCSPSCLKACKFDDKTIDLVNRHFPLGFEAFLNIALKNSDFKQIYFEHNRRKIIDPLGYHLLTLNIMTSLSSMSYDHYSEWVLGSESILDTAITNINNIQDHILVGELQLTSGQNFGEKQRKASIYEVTLISICGLMIRVQPDDFSVLELILLKHLISNRFWSSLISMDSWCFIGRLGSPELCANHVKYLLKVNAALSSHRCSLEVIVIETLIARLYAFLSDEAKHAIIAELDDLELNFCLPLCRLLPPKSQSLLQQKVSASMLTITEVFTDLQKQPSANNWKRIKSLLTLAGASSYVGDKSFMTVVLQSWELIASSIEEMQGRDLDVLLDFLIALINSVCLQKLPNETFTILKTILTCCSSFPPIIKVELLHYLGDHTRVLEECPSNVIDLLSDMICRLLEDTNPWVHQEALETFDNISHTSTNMDLVTAIAGRVAANKNSSMRDSLQAYLTNTAHYRIQSYTCVSDYLTESSRVSNSGHKCAQFEESRRKEKCAKVEPSEEELLRLLERLVSDLGRLSRGFLSQKSVERVRISARKLEEICGESK